MSRRAVLDAVVSGGGVVGAACALALARRGLQVALVEGAAPRPWRAEAPDLRVYAFAADNAALLDRLGAWQAIASARLQPYRTMRVWDAAGGGELAFDADAFARRELGWIVEHGLLLDRLWALLPGAGVRVHCPARVVGLEAEGAVVLDDGARLRARVAIAADGARSTLRDLAGIAVDARPYAQRGIVGYVASEKPHQETAWQRFLPGGPLALLPCADGTCSIVWTLPEAGAARVLALDDDAFGRELTRASDACLGELRPVSPRAAFPLQRQVARAFRAGNVLVMGDAAHVVHPLAGQGVNLGLRDVAGLDESTGHALAHGADWAAEARLARWARTRRSEAVVAAGAFDAINRVYSNDAVLATLLRGPLLGLAGRLPPVPRLLWKQAAGL